MLTLNQVNSLSFEDFLQHFGNIIEHCPLLAAVLWKRGPFVSIEHFVGEAAQIVYSWPISGSEFEFPAIISSFLKAFS